MMCVVWCVWCFVLLWMAVDCLLLCGEFCSSLRAVVACCLLLVDVCCCFVMLFWCCLLRVVYWLCLCGARRSLFAVRGSSVMWVFAVFWGCGLLVIVVVE